MGRQFGERAGESGILQCPSLGSSLVDAGSLAGGGDLFAAGFTAELVVARDGAVASQDLHLAEDGLVSKARLLCKQEKLQRGFCKWSEDVHLSDGQTTTTSIVTSKGHTQIACKWQHCVAVKINPHVIHHMDALGSNSSQPGLHSMTIGGWHILIRIIAMVNGGEERGMHRDC